MVLKTKRWDRRCSEALIEFASSCHDAQVVGPYWASSPHHLTILTAKSEDYTSAQATSLIGEC